MTLKPETIDDLTPAPYNPRTIAEASADALGESLDRFGDIAGIVWNQRTGHLVCGHQRVEQLRKRGAQLIDGALYLAAEDRGLDGQRSFPVRVVDWSEAEEKAANVTANNYRIGGEFTDGLSDLLEEIAGSIGEADFKDLNLDALLDDIANAPEEDDDDERYTGEVKGPLYEPTGEKPSVGQLYDTKRTERLCKEIEKADIDEETRRFLLHAAGRHTVFDYQSIAEFYAHAGPTEQRLMEDTALVIIDMDRAIELGFAKLTGALTKAYIESKEKYGEEEDGDA